MVSLGILRLATAGKLTVTYCASPGHFFPRQFHRASYSEFTHLLCCHCL